MADAATDPLDHRLGADRGRRLADQGSRLALDRAVEPADRAWRSRPATRSGRGAAGVRRCAGSATSSRAARPPGARRGGGRQRARDRHPVGRHLYKLSPPMAHPPQNHAVAARRAPARRDGLRAHRLRLFEQLQGRGRGRARRAEQPGKRRLFALPRPKDNEDSAYLVGQPRVPPGSACSASSSKSRTKAKRRRRWPTRSRSPTPATRPSRRSPAKASTRCPSAAKSNPRNRSRSSTRRPSRSSIEGSLVLFELPASASENRPLTLSIRAPKARPP